MNAKRILIGGTVAGALIAAGETLLEMVLVRRDTTGLVAEAVNATPFGIFLLRCFSLGICCVLVYVLIRPKVGAGPKTAITAGLLAFLFGVLFPSFGDTLNGTFPPNLILMSIIWSAVELPIAALIGAYLYQEESDQAVGAIASNPV